jgi:hypothetical protein
MLVLIFSHIGLANVITPSIGENGSYAHAHSIGVTEISHTLPGRTVTAFLYRTIQMMTMYAEERHSK